MTRLIGTLVMIFAFATMAEARVHSITPTQLLSPPDAYPYEVYPLLAVAIDGDSLIVIADRPGYRGAFLYRRRAADRHWSFSQTLMRVAASPAQLRAGLVMKNSLAVINLAGEASIWERAPTGWIQARTESPIRLPGGYAI